MKDTIVNSFEIWVAAQGIKSRTRVISVDNISLEGIARLRKLILEIAMSGKLVPQDSNDEPAQKLLYKIACKKEELYKGGLIKKQKTSPNIGDNEKPFKLPNGWEWTRLDAVAPMSLFDGDWIEKKDQDTNGSIRLIQLADIGEGYFVNKSDKFINEETFKKLKCTELQKDDILIARLPSPIGRCCLFPDLKQKSITAVDIAILRTLDLRFKDYLVYAINSIFFRNQIELFGKGVTRFRISTGNLKDILLPLPPIHEQYRITSKVNELMALCEKLEVEQFKNLKTHQVLVKTLLETLTQAPDANELHAAWERISIHFDTIFCTEDSIDQLKQVVLQLAVMGKLVKQDPEDEAACELLTNIAKEKERLVKEGKIKKQTPLPKISENKIPVDLPNGWIVTRFGHIIHLVSGQHLNPEEYVEICEEKMIPYLTGPAEFGDKRPAPTRYTFEKRAIAVKGDILITCKGSGVGKTNIANTDIAISRQLMAIRPIASNFQYLKLLTDSLHETFRENIIGIAIPGISRENITEAIIKLPPLSEQNRIVLRVDQIYSLCDSLKNMIQKSQNLKVLLSKTIVEKAVQ